VKGKPVHKWFAGWLMLIALAIPPHASELTARPMVSAEVPKSLTFDEARRTPPRPLDPSGNRHEGHSMSSPPDTGLPEFAPLTVADIRPISADEVHLSDWTIAKAIPPSAAPDTVGAFRLVCNAAHLSYDDPIAFPRQPGKSHLHMFFGNTGANADSDYASLRASGESTCQGGVLNRSAYWIPALLALRDPPEGVASNERETVVVVPDFVALYYKRLPASDPECRRAGERCTGIPVGLRAIFGTNYIQGHQESLHVRFDCNSDFSSQKLAEVAARCRGASHIYARVQAPDCWDGKRLDSANHRDHLAYMFYDGTRSTARCPKTHPVLIPKLTLIVAYAVLPGDKPETWTFSSDAMAGAEPGATFHADYMEAWEPEARLAWEANCLDKLLSCSGGDLGDGRIMREPDGFTFEQRPHLVAVPARR
jgi:hypothetical protein